MRASGGAIPSYANNNYNSNNSPSTYNNNNNYYDNNGSAIAMQALRPSMQQQQQDRGTASSSAGSPSNFNFNNSGGTTMRNENNNGSQNYNNFSHARNVNNDSRRSTPPPPFPPPPPSSSSSSSSAAAAAAAPTRSPSSSPNTSPLGRSVPSPAVPPPVMITNYPASLPTLPSSHPLNNDGYAMSYNFASNANSAVMQPIMRPASKTNFSAAPQYNINNGAGRSSSPYIDTFASFGFSSSVAASPYLDLRRSYLSRKTQTRLAAAYSAATLVASPPSSLASAAAPPAASLIPPTPPVSIIVFYYVQCVLAISCFSILGVALRQYFTFATGTARFFADSAFFAANALGSFIMGFVVYMHAVEIKLPWFPQSPSTSSFQLPILYLGVTTGFCGSLTTLSSWLLVVLPVPTAANGLMRVITENGIVQLITGITIPFVTYIWGEDLARVTIWVWNKYNEYYAEKHPPPKTITNDATNNSFTAKQADTSRTTATSSSSSSSWLPASINAVVASISDDVWKTIDVCVLAVVVVMVLLMAPLVDQTLNPGLHATVLTCVVGPLGALTRWLLANLFHDWIETTRVWSNQFRIGTFSANMLAVFIASFLAHCAASTTLDPNRIAWCGFTLTGLCGSLSTVSSWVADTFKLYRDLKNAGPIYAYFYASATISGGLFINALSMQA